MTADDPERLVEHERKFLVNDMEAIRGHPSTMMVQAYLVSTPKVELRVRSGPAGQILTIKGPRIGITRAEEEFILRDRLLAYALMEAAEGAIAVKRRYAVEESHNDGTIDHWTVDEYAGDNEGLVVAEYEYPPGVSPQSEVRIPSWAGRDVTHLKRYYAQHLCEYPYCDWTERDRHG